MFGLGIECSGHGTQGSESLGRSAARGTWLWALEIGELVAWVMVKYYLSILIIDDNI
jgi:hypothetical protein